uniref:PDZ domain-containing protein n=1 Tax=Panagrolaimus sp. PS1159 TaxID=55785 RepID=A0AC35FWJ0_9BILA
MNLHFGTHSPIITRSERLLAKGTSPRSRRRRPNLCNPGISGASSTEEVWIGAGVYRKQHPQLYFPSSESGSPRTPRSHSSMLTWSPCSSRSALPLGISTSAEVDKGINGCVVKSICSKKAIGRDGRIQVGDYLVKINSESLRNVTNSQARAILKRTNLIGTQCNVTYICASDARLWKQRFHREAESSSEIPPVNRLSPKVFPKFYKSPYLGRKIAPNNNSGPETPGPTTTDISSTTVGHLFSDSSFEDDDLYLKSLNKDEKEDKMHEQSMPQNRQIIIDETTLNVAEKFAKESTTTIIDGILIGEFANDLVKQKEGERKRKFNKAALAESFLELSISFRTTDWHRNREKTPQRKITEEEEFSQTSPPLSDESRPSTSTPTVPTLLKQKSSSIEKVSESPINVSMPYYESEPGPSFSIETAVTLPEVKPIPATSENKIISETEKFNMPFVSSSTSTSALPVSTEPHQSQNHSNKKKRNNFWGEARTVLLHREPNESFGISIVGGRVEISHKGGLPGTGNTVSGIFIKSVLPESPAGKSGKMFMGDRVISVNDIDLKDATHEYAVSVIKAATNPVKFIVQSLQSFSVHQQHQSHQNQQQQQQQQPSTSGTASSSSSSAISIKPQKIEMIQEKLFKKDDEERHVRMAESPISTPSDEGKSKLQDSESADSHKPVSSVLSTASRESQKKRKLSRLRESMRKKLDPESAAALPKSEDDPEEEDRFCYTQDKIKRKYGNLPGEPILIRLENIPPKGLGLSLAGNRDREKKSVFVVDIKSTSPLPLQVNDELLEINGKVLFGLSHVTATTKIRESCEGDELALLIMRQPPNQNQQQQKDNIPAVAISAVENMPATNYTSSSSTLPPKVEISEIAEMPSPLTISSTLEPTKTGDESSSSTTDEHAVITTTTTTATTTTAASSTTTLPTPNTTDGKY